MARDTDQERIDDLITQARTGDSLALINLRKLNEKLSRRANQRLRELRKAGFGDTAAAKRSKQFIKEQYGSKAHVYRIGKALDINQLAANLENVSQFLRWQTSTVRGERERRNNIIKGFRDKGFDIPKGSEQQFLDLLESPAFQESKAYGSIELIDMATQALAEGHTVEDLNKLYDDFVNRETNVTEDVFDVWTDWMGVDDAFDIFQNSGRD